MVYRGAVTSFLEPAPNRPRRAAPETKRELTNAERAVWNDPEQLARIEAVLDEPSLAVPLAELD